MENNSDPRYPSQEYNKTIYSFDPQELRELSSYTGIIIAGKLMEGMANKFVTENCLKRIGAKDSPDIHIEYDVYTGQFTVFSPKVWCTACKIRKANFEYKGGNYCQSCLDVKKVADAGKGKVKK